MFYRLSLLLFVVFLSACATVGTRVVAKPLVEIQPCLAFPIPKRAMIGQLTENENISYEDAQGNSRVAIKMIVTPESMLKFFDYIQDLESIAQHATGCVAR